MTDLPPLRVWAHGVMQAGSRSFTAAARLLPRDAREDAALLYAWCRHCDDVIDGQELGGEMAPPDRDDQRRRLAGLFAETRAALDGDAPVSTPFEALRHVARRHAFPKCWPMDLLAGMEADVEGHAHHTIDDTLLYAYRVAGVVGLMMARVMGVRDDAVLDCACDLGIAFQLTNIARDVLEDARAGRVYLPLDWLSFEDVAIDPAAPTPSPHVYRCIQQLLELAEVYYASARFGLPALPFRSAWAIAAARRIYREIGAEIRLRGPDAYRTRIATSKKRKLCLMMLAVGDARTWRRDRGRLSREGLWTRALHLPQREVSRL